MITVRGFIAGMAVLATLSACRRDEDGKVSSADAAILAKRSAQLARRTATPLAPGSPLAVWVLPRDLREISGLALTSDGRLLAHNDQRGAIFVIDPRRGVILKRFYVGQNHGVRGDFEGITRVGKSIYLLNSNGDLYEFPEGESEKTVRAKLFDTKLGKECEFEGVAYDPANQWLVMPCKNVGIKDLRDHLVIYRWALAETDSSRLSMISIPMADVVGTNGWKKLNPSDIAVDPATGNYVIIAAQEKAVIVLKPSGELVSSDPLPGRHQQAEGVAITGDSILIVSDEGANSSATISLFRWPQRTTTK